MMKLVLNLTMVFWRRLFGVNSVTFLVEERREYQKPMDFLTHPHNSQIKNNYRFVDLTNTKEKNEIRNKSFICVLTRTILLETSSWNTARDIYMVNMLNSFCLNFYFFYLKHLRVPKYHSNVIKCFIPQTSIETRTYFQQQTP